MWPRWAPDRAAEQQFAQKCSIMGRGLAGTRVGDAGYKIQDVVGGQGTAVAIYPGFSFYINLQYFMFISPIVPNINASCAIML